jgi:hypothetical protein
MRFFVKARVIHEEGLYVYNMHNIVEKHFNMSFEPVRSWDGLLVKNKAEVLNNSIG